ncbi:hypothetical protein IT408_04685 [Candidatus Uhrbacteria bacterium]|nr:hypothetical protein [Candidatus Uhrbacteria bacterium]
MSMESFPKASSPKKSANELPSFKFSQVEANQDDFNEQMSAKEAGKAISDISRAEGDFTDENFEDLEGSLNTLHLSKAEKAKKEAQSAEIAMQQEADDLTIDILRLKVSESLPEKQATEKAITDMCIKLQNEGLNQEAIGGRALHAYARYIMATSDLHKPDKENQAKIARMKDVVSKILGSNALGLGQDKVEHGGSVEPKVARSIGSEKVKGNQDISFESPDKGKTDQEPAMFRLSDLRNQSKKI